MRTLLVALLALGLGLGTVVPAHAQYLQVPGQDPTAWQTAQMWDRYQRTNERFTHWVVPSYQTPTYRAPTYQYPTYQYPSQSVLAPSYWQQGYLVDPSFTSWCYTSPYANYLCRWD